MLCCDVTNPRFIVMRMFLILHYILYYHVCLWCSDLDLNSVPVFSLVYSVKC